MMKRLFEGLWEGGAVVVATSNREPGELYKNGLQRRLFEPFIPLLEQNCPVHHMNSQVDYRLTGSSEGAENTYVVGLGENPLLPCRGKHSGCWIAQVAAPLQQCVKDLTNFHMGRCPNQRHYVLDSE